jgi:hypothetical protein
MRYNLINEDSNQFGPGTDLIICLLALLMIFVVIVSYLYGNEKRINAESSADLDNCRKTVEKVSDELKGCKDDSEKLRKRGEFKPAGEFLVAGTFEQNPYYKLKDPEMTEIQVQSIVEKYNALSGEYPYIFVIGHANEVGLEGKPDLTYEERLRYNWEFAGVRSAVIANLIQKHLSEEEKNKIIIVSTGEFDLKIPDAPESSENAFVEVFFGNEWKPQAYKKASP